MEWSAASATKAYLDTLKLCGDRRRKCDSRIAREPGSNEFISALAAGMKAKLIVEVTSGLSHSTIALATAARHTGGRLICILPEPELAESRKVIKDSGLKDIVEFKTGDPSKELPKYENIDFSLVDCKKDEYIMLLNMLDVNPRSSVVVANNLVGAKEGLGGHLRGMEDRTWIRSIKHPIGRGMEITMIGRTPRESSSGKTNRLIGYEERKSSRSSKRSSSSKKKGTSKWIVKVDEDSGEEHIYRVPQSI